MVKSDTNAPRRLREAQRQARSFARVRQVQLRGDAMPRAGVSTLKPSVLCAMQSLGLKALRLGIL